MAILNIKIQLDGDQFQAQAEKIVGEIGMIEGVAKVSFDSATASVAGFSFAFNQIATVVTQVAQVIAAPLAKFAEFETALANVRSLGVENIASLKTSILDLSQNISVPISSLSSGLYQVVSAGVDAASQISFLEITAKAAAAGVAETTDAINLSATVVKGYGKDWSETESILDQAFNTVKLGQTTFPELAGAIGQAVPLASALKIKSQELFGAFATLTGVTGGTSEVATQLKAVFTGLAAPTDDLTSLVKKHGFASVENAVAQQGLSGILTMLQTATGGSAAKMAELFGSVDAVNALLALAGPQYDTFNEKTLAMSNSAGEMSRAYETNTNTIQAHADILQNKLDVAQIRAVESLRPLIIGALDLATNLLEVDWQPFIIGATASGVALAAMNFPAILSGLGSLTTAVATFGGVLATSTGGITLAIGALAGLTVAILKSIPSEIDLASERKKTAEETIRIIRAEEERVNQSIKTDGATEESTRKLKLMNKELVRQQIIISDANIFVLEKQLEEAKEELDDFKQSIDEFKTTPDNLMTIESAVANLGRILFDQFGGDVIKINEEVNTRLIDIGSKRLSAISENEQNIVKQLDRERQVYVEIQDSIQAAANAQKDYNREIENRNRLTGAGGGSTAATGDEEGSGGSGKAAALLARSPIGKIKAEIDKVKKTWERLTQEPFVNEGFAELEEILKLKFDNGLLTEQQYIDERRALLETNLEVTRDIYGEDSRQYLEATLKKKQFDEEYVNKKKQLDQQSRSSSLNGLAGLMAGAQGISQTLFSLGKGASYAQALMDTYAAANLALKTYPPPFGAIAAAGSIATGLVNVAKISQVQFERKQQGGFLGDGFRTLLEGDFGGGENLLFVANSGEFLVNAEAAAANRLLLELINRSNGPVGSTPSTGSGAGFSAGSPTVVVNQDLSEVVEAIRDIRIQINANLNAMEFFRENFHDYERDEKRRRIE